MEKATIVGAAIKNKDHSAREYSVIGELTEQQYAAFQRQQKISKDYWKRIEVTHHCNS